MPTRDTRWPAGTPCWIDYGAADLDAAKAFYANLLGWSYSGGEPEFGGYLTAEKNGLAAAGMAPQMDPADPNRGGEVGRQGHHGRAGQPLRSIRRARGPVGGGVLGHAAPAG